MFNTHAYSHSQKIANIITYEILLLMITIRLHFLSLGAYYIRSAWYFTYDLPFSFHHMIWHLLCLPDLRFIFFSVLTLIEIQTYYNRSYKRKSIESNTFISLVDSFAKSRK